MIQAEVKEKLAASEVVGILREYGIRITVHAVWKWCRSGRLKKARLVGGRWYIDEEEVRAMVR